MSGEPRPGLQPPDPDLDYAAFPSRKLEPSQVLYRSHGHPHPGWFSSDLSGRFDLADPRGTCYLGDSIGMAIRERFGTQASHALEAEDVAAFVVSEITQLRILGADVSCEEAASFGVTSEMTSMGTYEIPQHWARQLAHAGFSGIRYVPRFTPGSSSAWALFGDAGEHPVGLVVQTIPGFDACARAGVRVTPQIPVGSDDVTLA